MPLLKKKLPKKTQLSVVNLIKHSQKKHLARKRFFRQREWLGSSPLHYIVSFPTGWDSQPYIHVYTPVNHHQPL